MTPERTMSPEAREIAEQKGKAWEYALTAALIRDWIRPIERRWKDLQGRLYAPARKNVPDEEFFDWVRTHNATLLDQMEVLKRLVNVELSASWGPPGKPGSVDDIKRVCSYLADTCSIFLSWEEDMHSARASEPYSEMVDLLRGALGPNISEVCKIQDTLDVMLKPGAEGQHQHTVVISLPPGFDERREEVMQHIREHLGLEEDYD